MPLMHVDLYRLDSGAAVDDLGLEELASGAVVAIEWAERLPRPIEGSVTVKIEDLGGDAAALRSKNGSGAFIGDQRKLLPTRILLRSVVRRFLRDRHVVHVALAEAGLRDLDEPRFLLQRGNVGAAAIAHAGAQPADELVNHRRHAALVGDAAFDAFRHQLLLRALVRLSSSNSSWKYRSRLPRRIAPIDPMPRYSLKLRP